MDRNLIANIGYPPPLRARAKTRQHNPPSAERSRSRSGPAVEELLEHLKKNDIDGSHSGPNSKMRRLFAVMDSEEELIVDLVAQHPTTTHGQKQKHEEIKWHRDKQVVALEKAEVIFMDAVFSINETWQKDPKTAQDDGNFIKLVQNVMLPLFAKMKKWMIQAHGEKWPMSEPGKRHCVGPTPAHTKDRAAWAVLFHWDPNWETHHLQTSVQYTWDSTAARWLGDEKPRKPREYFIPALYNRG